MLDSFLGSVRFLRLTAGFLLLSERSDSTVVEAAQARTQNQNHQTRAEKGQRRPIQESSYKFASFCSLHLGF